MMGVPQHLRAIPDDLAENALHAPDASPSTWWAISSLACRARVRNWPTIESKQWWRGSLVHPQTRL
jgi:hypothetical protein